MNIRKIIENIDAKIINEKICEVTNLCDDSRKCQKGSIFFCVVGAKIDAHNFASNAVTNGAVCLVVEKVLDIDVMQILVKNVRKAMALICNNFYNKVAQKLKFIGVTGTNGKTTTTNIIKHILTNNGRKVGLIGTNGYTINETTFDSNLTTPDTLDLYKILAEMNKAKVEFVIMEVSAHAIYLDKIYGIRFEIGVFTNLTIDHLDYFNNMENYFEVKKSFLINNCKRILLNIDDEYARRLLDIDKEKYLFGIDNPSNCFAIDIKNDILGSDFIVNIEDSIIQTHFRLAGKYNVYNVLASIYTAYLLGIRINDINNSLLTFDGVDGRFDIIKLKDFCVVIDYAHSPDALKNLLVTLKKMCRGRLIVVFGASGYRDSLKRPLMGEVVSQYCDWAIITSDNPRYEKPLDIINYIKKGYKGDNFEIEVLREEAIQKALNIAKENDIVAICGKGKEKYQNIMGVDIPYNDYEQVQLFIDKNK